MPKLFTTAEVADKLNCSPRTVLRMINQGQIKPTQKLDGLRGSYLFSEAAIAGAKRRNATKKAA